MIAIASDEIWTQTFSKHETELLTTLQRSSVPTVLKQAMSNLLHKTKLRLWLLPATTWRLETRDTVCHLSADYPNETWRSCVLQYIRACIEVTVEGGVSNGYDDKVGIWEEWKGV